MGKLLSSAIQKIDHLAAIDEVVADRFASLDLSVLLMYVIDSAPEAALYSLAEQFHVLGWEGWNLATTVEQKRELVKQSIELHKKKGTPWAIKQAIKTVGFDDASITEGVGTYYDATYNHDGAIIYSAGNDWPYFRVTIYLPNGIAIDAATFGAVKELILAYKNQRSWLVDITFHLTFTDELMIDDTIDDDSGLADEISPGIYYDGTFSHDGGNNHGHIQDTIGLTVYDGAGNIISNDEF